MEINVARDVLSFIFKTKYSKVLFNNFPMNGNTLGFYP